MSDRSAVENAVSLYFEEVNGVTFQGAEFFRVRDGKIYFDQTFFDSRPLLKGS